MAKSIFLEERKKDNSVIEGSLSLEMSPNLTKDVTIIIPNENGEYVTKEILETGTYNISILGGSEILLPLRSEEFSTGVFKISNYTPLPTYVKEPNGYILEIATDTLFTNIIKTFTRSDFNKEFTVSFDEGGETLYARVRTYTSAHYSNNSTIVKFKLVNNLAHKPTILTPVNNSVNNPFVLQVNLSDYSYIGKNNYCDGVGYEIAKDSEFKNIVDAGQFFRDENVGEIIDYNNYVKSFILNKLSEDTEYYIRVAYIGKISGAGEWSDVVKFKTYNLPDMKISTNLNNNIDMVKIENNNIIASVYSNVINLITIDNNFSNISINKNIVYNELNLAKINLNKMLVDINNDIFIFGTMEYDGTNYTGPIKKQFVTKYNKDGANTISIEVKENITAFPYTSKLEFKNSILYKDMIIIFGTIPHPTPNNESTLTSCYVLSKNLDIVAFKNFSKSTMLDLNSVVINNDKIICGGVTVGDVGYGLKKQAILVSFNISDNYVVTVDNSKLFSNELDSRIGGLLTLDNKIMATLITTDTNFVSGTTTLLTIDNNNIPIKEVSLNGNYLLTNINLHNAYYRMVGKSDIHGVIVDIDNNDNILLSKCLNGFGEVEKYLNLNNNIATFKSKSSNDSLLVNGDISITTNVTNLTITKTITNSIKTSIPTIETITHEPIKQSINNAVTNGTSAIVKTNI